jgi:hypothetical protein
MECRWTPQISLEMPLALAMNKAAMFFSFLNHSLARVLATFACVFTVVMQAAVGQGAKTSEFDLTAEQRARVAQFLPHSLPKLEKRLPFHVVVLGDEVAGAGGFDDNAGNVLLAYPAEFLEMLAGQFFYAGGVRVIKPAGKHPAKRLPTTGDEITLRSLAGRGRTVLDGGPMWEALGKNPAPDLVIIGYGSLETAMSMDLAQFSAGIEQLIKSAKSAGADVILTGPTLTATEPVEYGLAATRAYAAEMERLALKHKCLFVDLGDLAPLLRLPPSDRSKPPLPEEVFESVVDSYLGYFRWADVDNQTIPQPALHKLLGRQVFRTLLSEPPATPWVLRRAEATFTDADNFTLAFSVNNPGTEPLPLMVLPLVPAGWLPQDATPEDMVKPGKTRKMEIHYKRDTEHPPPACTDGLLHLPVLVSDGAVVRIQDINAPLQPFSAYFPPLSQYAVENSFKLSNRVSNNTGAALAAVPWTVEMGGIELNGTADLPPGESTLPIDLPLPKDADVMKLGEVVTLTLTHAGKSYRWTTHVEMSRHMGLKQLVPLKPRISGKAAAPDIPVRFEADSSALYITADISAIPLEDDPQGTALVSTLGLDARAFEKRLRPGAIELVRYRLGVADGYGETSRMAPWTFGDGYAAEFDPAAMTIRLQSSSGGQRRVTWVIPRNYLYLHDFTPGNGNSHLGISLTMQFYRQAGEGTPAGFPPQLSYALSFNGRMSQDAGSLSVLELTDAPTKRWAVVHW